MRKLLIMTLLLTNTVLAGVHHHYWTSEDIRQYLPDRPDILGKEWWSQDNGLGYDTDNSEDIGELPVYAEFTANKPLSMGGWTEVYYKTYLVSGSWEFLTRFRTQQPGSYTFYIPAWNEYEDLFDNSDALFFKIGNTELVTFTMHSPAVEHSESGDNGGDPPPVP